MASRKRSGRVEGLSSRDQVLDEAARLFAIHGYDTTSVREIATAVGVSAPALYNHFPSKEEIFCATHELGMNRIGDAVVAAIDGVEDPWDRLETAAAAHCQALLETQGYRTIITPYFPKVSEPIRARLVAQRDAYETIIRRLVADLPLADHVDRSLLRMHVLGALNWATAWYRPGGRVAPAEIGRTMVRYLRQGVGQ